MYTKKKEEHPPGIKLICCNYVIFPDARVHVAFIAFFYVLLVFPQCSSFFFLSFEQFLKMSHQLSQLDTYSQLQQRSERIGYEVQKIVFRGYHSSEQLQVSY